VHAASEMGEWKKKSKIKANEPEAKQNVEEAEERRSSALIGRTSGRNLSNYVKSVWIIRVNGKQDPTPSPLVDVSENISMTINDL